MQVVLGFAQLKKAALAALKSGNLDAERACEVQRALGLCAGKRCSACRYNTSAATNMVARR